MLDVRDEMGEELNSAVHPLKGLGLFVYDGR